MSAPIKLVQFPGMNRGTTLSPPCGKVHMALRYKGLDYELVNVSAPHEIKRYNARGRVPVLLVGEERLVDSSDILSALDERYPDPPLDLEDARERARVRLLEDWADEVLYFYGVYLRFLEPANFARLKSEVFAKMPAPIRWFVPAVALRMVKQRLAGQGVGTKPLDVVQREARECLDALVDRLGGEPFFVGGRFTRADLSLAAVLDQWTHERLSPELAEEVMGRPALAAWLERVHAHAPSAAV